MKLHFRSMGQGPALIILHGLFGSSDNWQTLAKRFSEHYTVYLVDQRTHGRSVVGRVCSSGRITRRLS